MALNETDLSEYTLKDFRKHLSVIVHDVTHGQKRVKVTCYGRTAGYFVSAEEMTYLEALEEALDSQAVDRIRAQGGKRIPWTQIKAQHGLS
jgi:PHD/YefM family antitoxin component YafN of YafNO toxin-antitoxin module